LDIIIIISMPVTSSPALWWRAWNALRGTNPTTLTEKDVPVSDLSGKWIIITGSNNGVGFEAAKKFAKAGANLILACRDPPPTEQHPTAAVAECQRLATSSGHDSTIEWWEINMADLASADTFAQRWLDTKRPLDILCNNAGMQPPAADVRTKDGLEIVHQVNFLSHVLLTYHLLPSLAKAAEPRIICTTSCLHFLGFYDMAHFNSEEGMAGEPYGNNKLYYQMWVVEMSRRLLAHPSYKHITINGIHPGYVYTGIWNNPRPDAGNSFRFPFFRWLASWLAISPEQGSLAIVYAATSEEFRANRETQGVGVLGGKGGGHYINRIWEAEPMPYCRDEAGRLEVWGKVSDELKLEDRGLADIL
jgi:NAD(P)-dependent dehydrogenase (short-subunit alcohol dehydrogenase family)